MWRILYGRGFKHLGIAEKVGVVGLWATAIALMLAVFSAVVGVWAVRAAEDIAVRSGAFDVPQVHIYFAAHTVATKTTTYIAYGLPFDKNSLALVRLSITVANDGAKTAKNVAVVIRCPKWIVVTDESQGELHSHTILPLSRNPERHVSLAGNNAYLIYSLPDMNPGSRIELNEPLMLKETSIEDSVPLKDNSRLSYRLDYSFEAAISVAVQDQPVVDYPVSISALKALDDQSLLVHFFKIQVGRARMFRIENGWWKYLVFALTARDEPNVLVLPKAQRQVDPTKPTIVVLNGLEQDAEVLEGRFNPFSLWLTFHAPTVE